MGRQHVVMSVRRWWVWIVALAREREIEPAVLAGLVAQESAGEQFAQRYEPAYRWIYDKPDQVASMAPTDMSRATFIEGQKISYGLCQIMGGVALERGFRGWWGALFDPGRNLTLGADHLAQCIKRKGGNLIDGLLRYNGGGNPKYADHVLSWAAHFRKEE